MELNSERGDRLCNCEICREQLKPNVSYANLKNPNPQTRSESQVCQTARSTLPSPQEKTESPVKLSAVIKVEEPYQPEYDLISDDDDEPDNEEADRNFANLKEHQSIDKEKSLVRSHFKVETEVERSPTPKLTLTLTSYTRPYSEDSTSSYSTPSPAQGCTCSQCVPYRGHFTDSNREPGQGQGQGQGSYQLSKSSQIPVPPFYSYTNDSSRPPERFRNCSSPKSGPFRMQPNDRGQRRGQGHDENHLSWPEMHSYPGNWHYEHLRNFKRIQEDEAAFERQFEYHGQGQGHGHGVRSKRRNYQQLIKSMKNSLDHDQDQDQDQETGPGKVKDCHKLPVFLNSTSRKPQKLTFYSACYGECAHGRKVQITEYSCKFCTERFRNVDELSYHETFYHKIPIKRAGKFCPECGNRYSWRTSLQRHLRTCHASSLSMYDF